MSMSALFHMSARVTYPNDPEYVACELLITVQRSFNQSFLLSLWSHTNQEELADFLQWSLNHALIQD